MEEGLVPACRAPRATRRRVGVEYAQNWKAGDIDEVHGSLEDLAGTPRASVQRGR